MGENRRALLTHAHAHTRQEAPLVKTASEYEQRGAVGCVERRRVAMERRRKQRKKADGGE